MSSLKYDYTYSYGQRRNISFLKTAHWHGLNFLHLFIIPKNLNLKVSENLAALTFLREMYQLLPSQNNMYALFDS